MIKLQLIGNLGKDCQVNQVNGKQVINFQVGAMDRDKTTWVDCAWWTESTKVAQYLKKGQSVFAEGTPSVKEYTTKDGKSGVKQTLFCTSVQLIGSNKTEAKTPLPVFNTVESDDDLPF